MAKNPQNLMAFHRPAGIIIHMGAAIWTMVLVVLGPLAGWGCGRVRPVGFGVGLLAACLALAAWPIANDWWSASVDWPWLVALLLLHLVLVLVPYGIARSARFAKRRTRFAHPGR